MSVDAWNERSAAEAAAGRAHARPASRRLRPVIGWPEAMLQLWRAKWLMFLVFLAFLLAATAIALSVPIRYEASTRLLIRLGQERVFDPVVADVVGGTFPELESAVRVELEIARSRAVAERVIDRIGLSRLYPSIAREAVRGEPNQIRFLKQKAVAALAHDFVVSAVEQSTILHITFRHADAATVVETLDAFVESYMAYRREVLLGQGASILSAQRTVIEERLAVAEGAVRAFLVSNGIADYEAEQEVVARLYRDASDDLATIEASLREAQARAGRFRQKLAETPRVIDLFVEADAPKELDALKLKRDGLLSRYRPDSRTVQDLDLQISQMERLETSGEQGGLKRIGLNPTWQSLEGALADAEADAAALSARLSELARQKDEIEQRRAVLASFEPEYRRLARERDALEFAATSFASREQVERLRMELAERDDNAVSVLEVAQPTAKSGYPAHLIAAGGAVLGFLTALIIGLLQVWSLRTLPTAGTVERTLGLPVLASLRQQAAK